MSIENLVEYARKCVVDPELRAQAKEIGFFEIDEQIVHSKSLGLEWSKADMEEYKKNISADGELSEEDLEQVAGGLVTTTAAAVVSAGAAVATAGAAVTTTTQGSGW
jgi:predicted ribosomally synthesized peptide with nif11-like leader